jgi:hypothetical protein
MFRNRTFVGSQVSDWYGQNPLLRVKDYGTLSNPATSAYFLKNNANITTSGAYWIKFLSGDTTLHKVWCDMTTLGGGWMLAFSVTNFNGDTADWFSGSFGSESNWFTSTAGNNLNLSYSESLLNKVNMRLPAFTSYSFSNMMIMENFGGSISYKAYSLNSEKTFLQRFSAANNSSYINEVSSIIGTAGSTMSNGSSSFSSNTLMFNYDISNDGARLASTPAASEATGGICGRVDGGQGYAWRGNLTRDDSARQYASDGTTTDHTIWVFVRN